MTIRKILADFLEMDPKRSEDDAAYRQRLALAVSNLEDDEYNKLDGPTQDWANAACDAINKVLPVPAFPDEAPPPAPATTRTRRAAAPAPEAAPREPQVGDTVTAVTARSTFTGKLVEMDAEVLVIDDGEKEHEVTRSRVTSFALADKGGSPAVAEPEPPGDPEVGDTVQVTTLRGAVMMLKLTEITDADIVGEDPTGTVQELSRTRIKDIVVKSRGAAAAPTQAPPPATRRGRAETTTAAPAVEPAASKRTTKADTGGVSVGMAIRTVIANNMGWTQEQVAAQLKKDGIDVKDNTLALNYSDAHKMIKLLKELGKLK